MSFGQRFLKFISKNVVLITGGSIIFATHWGWSKLQHSSLVPEDKRTELPIIIGARYLEQKIADEISHLKQGKPIETDKAP